MKITYTPHALEQLAERGISEETARAVLEAPDREYPGRLSRTVAERRFEGERSAVKVVYDLGLEDERIVVTVERGRPSTGGSE